MKHAIVSIKKWGIGRMGRRRLWAAAAATLGLALIAAAGLGAWLFSGLPSAENLAGRAAAPSSAVFDRYGRLLFEMPPPHGGNHSPVPLGDVPEALRHATVVTEDASFYSNPGVDLVAIVRAVWINLRGGEVLSGGSTITQQLARNLLMSEAERSERTLRRKLRESVLAWRLARRYSKDQILELYLNETYYGNMAYGVQAAAQAYFGKDVRDLDLAECALLAGLPQAPAVYNPLENLEAARARQAVVLRLMVKDGLVSEDQARLAQDEPLALAAAPIAIHAPHFVMYVRARLEEKLGLERLERGGLRIVTTLDLDLNETARDVVRYRMERLAQCERQSAECPPGGHNVRNAALVAMDPATGEILAMLGSPDYFSARIAGAVNGTTALRQPGSSIKPITYAAAFESRKLTAATMMLDLRTSFVTREGTPYVPLNYDLRWRGPVRLREALASSYNVMAVKVLDSIGVQAMTNLARRLGITTFDDEDRLGLSVTLGGGEVRLLEETAAFGAFANGGYRVKPVAILRVEDAAGQVIYSERPQGVFTGDTARAVDERVAYLITSILSDPLARIPTFGDGSVLELSRPAAVKTGTTTDYRDNWTVGYTPELAVGVWVGNADNDPMHDISGVTGAAPIWHDFMEAALRGLPPREFKRPDGLVELEVCALSGLRPSEDCPHRVTELFLPGTEPAETCAMHRRIAVDRATGLRATAATPPERVVERVYTILPPEAREWGREQGIAEPPGELPAASHAPAAGSGEIGRSPTASLQPPIILLTPDRGAVFRLDPALPRDAQRILVSAVAGNGTPLAQVTLFADGRPLRRFTSAPYEVLWRVEAGEHLFWAEGVDASGKQVRSNRVRVRVEQ
jgi:1A family penicillin-binding protein